MRNMEKINVGKQKNKTTVRGEKYYLYSRLIPKKIRRSNLKILKSRGKL